MKVFSIHHDERFQSLAVIDSERFMKVVGTGGFTGASMAERWELLDYGIADPSKRAGDFFAFTANTFAFTQRVCDSFRDLFEVVGEILPISIEGVPHHVLNVLRRIDALDVSKSNVRTFYGNRIAAIDRHEFVRERIANESIFLIFQQAGGLYTVADNNTPTKDFRRRATEGGFCGLAFKNVWEAN